MQTATPKTSKPATGEKLKSLLNDSPSTKAITWGNSFIVEEKVNPDIIRSFYGMDHHPVHWFEMNIGQLIYAISEKDFVGMLQIVNKRHAAKLFDLQGNGYTFSSVLRVGERAAEKSQEPTVDEPVKLNNEDIERFLKDAHNKIYEIKEGTKAAINDATIPDRIKDRIADITREELDKLETASGTFDYYCDSSEGHLEKNWVKIMAAVNALQFSKTFAEIQHLAENIHTQVECLIAKYIKENNYQDNVLSECYNLLYDSNENDSYVYLAFVRRVKKFLFDPSIATLFYSQFKTCNPQEVYETLENLENFFDRVGEVEYDAELELFNVQAVGKNMTYQTLSSLQSYYTRLINEAKR
jgi:hypothetical protein